MRRLFAFLKRGPDLDFYASSWVDEIWVRTTILACVQRRLRPRLVMSGGVGRLPGGLQRYYADLNVPVVETGSVAELHKLRMRYVVTASSGIPRDFFGRTLRWLAHMPHSLASLHMIYPEDAFDSYDVLFAAGPHHATEWALMRARAGLPLGTVYSIGYGKMDLLADAYRSAGRSTSGRSVLIAPSWGDDNLLRLMGPQLVRHLLTCDVTIVLRPHPSFFLRDEPELAQTVAAAGDDARFSLETSTDIEGTAMLSADVMITDYSGIAFEYAALRHAPTIFVDLPKKVVNERWEELGAAPVEIALRDHLGALAAPAVEAVVDAVMAMLDKPVAPQAIEAAVGKFLYAAPRVGERAAAQLATMLKDRH